MDVAVFEAHVDALYQANCDDIQTKPNPNGRKRFEVAFRQIFCLPPKQESVEGTSSSTIDTNLSSPTSSTRSNLRKSKRKASVGFVSGLLATPKDSVGSTPVSPTASSGSTFANAFNNFSQDDRLYMMSAKRFDVNIQEKRFGPKAAMELVRMLNANSQKHKREEEELEADEEVFSDEEGDINLGDDDDEDDEDEEEKAERAKERDEGEKEDGGRKRVSFQEVVLFEEEGAVDEEEKEFVGVSQIQYGIKSISLANNNIGNEGAIELASFVESNHLLRKLDLRSNAIGANGMIALADAFQSSYIHELDLSSCAGFALNTIGEKGHEALGRFLSSETCHLQVLKMNGVGTNGLSFLAKGLRKNTSLSLLDLRANQIKDEDLSAICDGVSKSHVRKLQLSRNPMSLRGVESMARLICNARHLEVLQASKCIENMGIAIHFAEYLNSKMKTTLHTNITHLNLSHNSFHDQAVQLLSPSLLQLHGPCGRLMSLSLSDGFITDVGAAHIMRSLKHNISLTSLNLSYNKISDEYVFSCWF